MEPRECPIRVSIEGVIMGIQLELDFEGAIALARQDPVQMELFELLIGWFRLWRV